MKILLCLIIAYLLGSLSSAIILSKLLKLPDPRTEGSKNPGATNMLRLSGKKIAVITLVGDMLKGVIAVLLARLLGVEGVYLSFVALAVFLGHVFPIYFGFHGGKGVATAFGAILALSPLLAIGVGLVWIIVAKLTRYSSLAALSSAITCPVLSLYLTGTTYFLGLLLMSLVLIWRHHANIVRLLAGKEPKIGETPSKLA